MIINDIADVLYAPVKAFKRIIEKPQYLGALIIILLFVGVMVGYESAEFSKIYTENTSPQIGKLSTYTNATYWSSPTGVNVSNNYSDYFNYSVYVVQSGYPSTDSRAYYNLFANYTNDVGPSSLEINAANTNTITAALTNISSIDCSASGFQNLSMTIKQVTPQNVPQSATLTLYSTNDTSFFAYDLTSSISNESINAWNNLTIPVGPNAHGWTSNGNPAWGNITSLKLDFTYPTSSNITVRIGALFFRGQYLNALQYGSTNLVLGFEAFPLQILFSWFLLTGIIYIFFKGLKTDVVWKPLFIAVSFALVVMVIRGIVNLIAALATPAVYFPFDVAPGTTSILGAISYPTGAAGTLTAMSQAAVTTINSSTAALGIVIFAMFAISYVWLGALCTIIVGTLKPEFSMTKRILISAVSVGATILLLLLGSVPI